LETIDADRFAIPHGDELPQRESDFSEGDIVANAERNHSIFKNKSQPAPSMFVESDESHRNSLIDAGAEIGESGRDSINIFHGVLVRAAGVQAVKPHAQYLRRVQTGAIDVRRVGSESTHGLSARPFRARIHLEHPTAAETAPNGNVPPQ
jgi:hypothetical protein